MIPGQGQGPLMDFCVRVPSGARSHVPSAPNPAPVRLLSQLAQRGSVRGQGETDDEQSCHGQQPSPSGLTPLLEQWRTSHELWYGQPSIGG